MEIGRLVGGLLLAALRVAGAAGSHWIGTRGADLPFEESAEATFVARLNTVIGPAFLLVLGLVFLGVAVFG